MAVQEESYQLNLSKYRIFFVLIVILGLVLVFLYSLTEAEKPVEILNESQLQQQSETILKGNEATVKIPTHHSEGEKNSQ